MVECCGNCKYGTYRLQFSETHTRCQCRKRAPRYSQSFMQKFPIMRLDDYCGDWEPEVKEDGD